jgi:hypothetical protein
MEAEKQIHLGPQFRFIYMKRTLSLLALGTLILMPATGRADDSIGEKAADVVHGIGEGIKDAVHDVKQAAAGNDVEVSLGDTHMIMPTSVDAGDVTFKVNNVGSEERGFKISGPGLERFFTAPLPPGQSEKMTVNLKPGEYQVEAPAVGDPTKHLVVELSAVAK